jgi:WXXGXW repeat (2 copies)
MKKLLIIFSMICLALTTAFGQDDVYYSDTSNIETKAQQAPPAMPDYVQPPCPEDGYLWQPGYWAWGALGYYWVPGVWVLPPHAGLLWTPGWWGFYGGFYGWHPGFWGPHVGFYGGINYGFGYTGIGFYGGRWEGGVFHYNSAAWHVDAVHVHNVYEDRAFIHNGAVNHASFNGPGGVRGRPSPAEMNAMHESHERATKEQMAHREAAGGDRRQYVNNGRPSTATMNRANGQHFTHEGHPAPAFHGGGGGFRGGGGHGGGRR